MGYLPLIDVGIETLCRIFFSGCSSGCCPPLWTSAGDVTSPKTYIRFQRCTSFRTLSLPYSTADADPPGNYADASFPGSIGGNQPTVVPLEPDAPFNGFIPIDELDITYSRSSGPGGQNVNCVNTKVDLRFNIQKATWLNDELKPKLLEKYNTKINKEGYLVIKSDVTRSQQLNLADAMEKLRTMIRAVAIPEPQISEETEEKLRRRHLKAVRERLIAKRKRSDIKQSRQNHDVDF
ncbi:peptidyl-tRNA hydrolase ICT1, mitochondrial isoform X2 [Athalia rosae]|uniref:peptidyl-tRNA hydrolase ICT1, mitochondrial isoform X2 n=1 Tax=Athalia rosae TaxID=37344 RepID=UPI00203405DC|nr:peptidyl-tRNA hydrolase ICT1, mitochondrial isoform X2 [Athalia rosae]